MAAGSGPWYVVTIRNTKPQTPFTIQVMQKPFPGPPYQVLIEHTGGANGSGYKTRAEAQAAADKFRNEPVPGINAGNPLSGIAAVGDLFSRLSQANTWIRVGEALLGLVLLGIGLARITGTQNLISTAVKAAPA